jgi:antitoxin component YwqK of YwqJK toxin-antitoxin module
MKMKIVSYCLLAIASLLTSCSSDSTKKSDNTPSDSSSMSIDTSLKGLTGVIEKNPPVVNGDFVSKYQNGIVKMKGYYINGKREGQWVSFFENGQKQSEGFFKNGLRDGKALVYHQNGQLYYEGFYKDGKEVGKWTFFDPQGKKLHEKDYDSKPNS